MAALHWLPCFPISITVSIDSPLTPNLFQFEKFADAWQVGRRGEETADLFARDNNWSIEISFLGVISKICIITGFKEQVRTSYLWAEKPFFIRIKWQKDR